MVQTYHMSNENSELHGSNQFGIHKTQVKIIVPGPTYTLQEKYINWKNKNKNFIPDENKNTCQQFIFYISGTNTFIFYICGTFEDFGRMQNNHEISKSNNP